ncbi:hypothetical protein ACFXC8_54560 [Streptomyces sp. NPDC059441]|uniref:hypothetical protein n=1 Tax=Streptomyces sp. NPDC059441 TaxID=3346829 RepID=UPI00369ED0D9
MSGTAEYKSKWCTSDDDKDGRTEDTPRAVVGTKGASGAKTSDEIAVSTPCLVGLRWLHPTRQEAPLVRQEGHARSGCTGPRPAADLGGTPARLDGRAGTPGSLSPSGGYGRPSGP